MPQERQVPPSFWSQVTWFRFVAAAAAAAVRIPIIAATPTTVVVLLWWWWWLLLSLLLLVVLMVPWLLSIGQRLVACFCYAEKAASGCGTTPTSTSCCRGSSRDVGAAHRVQLEFDDVCQGHVIIDGIIIVIITTTVDLP